MTTVAGGNKWVNSVERADDGDPVSEPTWQSIDELADRTKFLALNSHLSIANHRLVKSTTAIDRFTGACWAAGAGPYDYGLFAAVGVRSGGGAGISLSNDGESWVDATYALMGGITEVKFRGITHGGSGALGARVFVICGSYDDSGTDRPTIMSVSDAADANVSDLVPEIANGSFVGRYTGAALAGWLRSVTWNGTVFCAVGDNGLIVTLSADLATATVRTAGSSYTGDFYHVFADSAGRLFACGDSGEIQRSTNDGATWARVNSDVLLGPCASGVAITLGSSEYLVVGTSDENKVLRSTNNGASFTEIEIIPTATFDGSQVLVYKLGAILGVVLRGETNDNVARAYYSLDGGATWPYTNRPMTCLGCHVVAAAENGQRAVLVGGSVDATTAAYAFTTDMVLAPA